MKGLDPLWGEVVALAVRDLPEGAARDALLFRARARARAGMERYGRPIPEDPGADYRREAIEEFADACVYLAAALRAAPGDPVLADALRVALRAWWGLEHAA